MLVKRHHYLVTLRVSAPNVDDLDELDVEHRLLGPASDDVPHPLRVEDVEVSIAETDVPEPEVPSLSPEDRNPGMARETTAGRS